MQIVSTEHLLEPAVNETLQQLDLADEDAGAAKLALTLARTIDQMDADTRQRMLPNTAGALLRTLESLGATPKARAAIRKELAGTTGRSAVTRLQALRDAR